MLSFKTKNTRLLKIVSLVITIAFLGNMILPTQGFAQMLALPAPGTMLTLTPQFAPPIIKGLEINCDNPLEFNFFINTGEENIQGEELKQETEKMVKYFLTSLTIPEDELWVNLSPYEKDRIIPDEFSLTDMGRDLLAEDYILKQITASLVYPEDELGKKFWDKVYKKAYSQYGTTDIPLDTFNKVWILPDKAVVYETGNRVFVAESTLKVMIEEDYIALQHSDKQKEAQYFKDRGISVSRNANLASEIVREIVIPEITKEVNQGKHFAQLRQIYSSLILANWFKKSLQESLLGQIYVDKKKINGLNINDPDVKEKIYNQYLEAYKKGAYNYIKAEYDPNAGRNIPRKYFSGGSRLVIENLDRTSIPPIRNIRGHEKSGIVSSSVLFVKPEESSVKVASSSIKEIPRSANIPGFQNVKKGELFFGKYDKLYPLAKNFLAYYGGDKNEYKVLREISSYIEKTDFFVGATENEYADINLKTKRIVLNEDFMDFLFKTGRKKIAMSFIAGLVAEAWKEKVGIDIKDLEILVGASKRSLTGEKRSRLDDTKELYQLKKKVIRNDTLEGARNPSFLSDKDIFLFMSDMLHRGKVLGKRRLAKYLEEEYLFYGKISQEKAADLLAQFSKEHSDIVEISEIFIEDPIEDLKNKLSPDAKIIYEEADGVEQGKKITLYGLKRQYIQDPAFQGRATVWDIEVERQDEVNFGGKTAHTGEMMFCPYVVTLPNFATSGELFQRLFITDIKTYLLHIETKIKEIYNYLDKNGEFLDKNVIGMTNEEKEKLEKELALRGVAIDFKEDASAQYQIRKTLKTMISIVDDFTENGYENLNAYFQKNGKSLDQEVNRIKEAQEQLKLKINALDAQIKTSQRSDLIKGKAALDDQLQELQLEYEHVTSEISEKLLIAARLMTVPEAVKDEMKRGLVKLAERLGIPLEKLVLAIRSSAVGEDSETASFAGRQDTYIFVTPFSEKEGEDGLDFIIQNWIFNQASLFNKRAIDYRFEHGLPTFDEHAEISTLLQEMFLSQISFIGFSLDRETGFPVMSLSATEGQGEKLVSGDETGSKFFMEYDGTLLLRAKGKREKMVVETAGGLGKQEIDIPDNLKSEFVITDFVLAEKTAFYFKVLHDFYGGFVDLEGAFRVKKDNKGNDIILLGENQESLKDERGFPRKDWTIVSTQARPETVWSSRDPDVVFLKDIIVTDKAFEKAQKEGRVLPFNFLAKTGGAAQGEIYWVLDKNPETLARTINKIMAAYQSDPDMNSAMQAARGIIAQKGGPNSHTMIVASEFGLVAVTGITNATFEDVRDALPNGTEITIDANRGKILLGMDHELKVAGKDFSIKGLPSTPYGDIRLGVFAATTDKAYKGAPLRNMPSFYGIGLDRQELTLTNSIGIYPDLLLAYDNMIRRENHMSHEGPILDREKDKDEIKYVEEAIKGYNSAEDFYVSTLYESLLSKAVSTIPSENNVLVRAQSLADYQLRIKVLNIVKQYYRDGLGRVAPLHQLEGILKTLIKKVGGKIEADSDAEILSQIVMLLDKRHYIRLDDRKTDEYEGVYSAERFIKREVNPMKGFRGLDLMFHNPQVLRWQLGAIKKVLDTKKVKIGVFAPIVRRPEDVTRMLEVMDELGMLTEDIKVGIMTEIPTNSINVEDFLMAAKNFEDETGKKLNFFFSTGGNDALQTNARIDRNTDNKALKDTVNAYSPSVLRWNARIAKIVRDFNKKYNKKYSVSYCGNDPSVPGQDDYGAILKAFGYDAVSVLLEVYERVAKNLANTNFEIPQVAKDAVGFDFDMDPKAIQSIKKESPNHFNIGEFLLTLGMHFKAFESYDKEILPTVKEGKMLAGADWHIYRSMYQDIRNMLRENGYSLSIDKEGIGLLFYRAKLKEAVREAAYEAKKQGKKLFISTDNIFSSEYQKLKYGEVYEPKEANPGYGVHGLVKSLNDNRKFFKVDLEIIKELIEEDNDNIVLELKAVRSFEEIKKVRELLGEIELGVPLAVSVEVPANLYEIKEILDPNLNISYLDIADPLRLVSDLMALEEDNINGVDITKHDVDYQLRRPILILATAAKKAGVPFYVNESIYGVISDLANNTEKLFPLKEKKGEASSAVVPTGGIDFNRINFDMQIKRDKDGIPLPVKFQDVGHIDIDGLVPMIINFVIITDLPWLLGMANENNFYETEMSREYAEEPKRLSFLK
ncbi:MAG: PEP/pyruvate-binding domain-containing protein [Candidatus Omnitrophica bacterium]|nr:PEP/pyruvate-binding domain-containing protein [Candidatus Omnitrophota bacterium]